MGIGNAMLLAPLAEGRKSIVVGPEPAKLFSLATGCGPWGSPHAPDRKLARELAPPLEELMIAKFYLCDLLLVLAAWVPGYSRFSQTFPDTARVESTSGIGRGGTAGEVSLGYAMEKGVSEGFPDLFYLSSFVSCVPHEPGEWWMFSVRQKHPGLGSFEGRGGKEEDEKERRCRPRVLYLVRSSPGPR